MVTGLNVLSECLTGEGDVIVRPGFHGQEELNELLVLDLLEEGEPLPVRYASAKRGPFSERFISMGGIRITGHHREDKDILFVVGSRDLRRHPDRQLTY